MRSARSRFAFPEGCRRWLRSWTAAALFSLVLHGLLLQLAHLSSPPPLKRAPVQAYLASSPVSMPAPPAAFDPPAPAVPPREVRKQGPRWSVPLQVADLSVDPAPDLRSSRAAEKPSVAAESKPPAPAAAAGLAAPAYPLAQLEIDILHWLQRHRRYPRSALRLRLQGEVEVKFSLSREGLLLHSAVVKSSGYALLDQAALELLQRAQPYPLPALEGGIDQLELSLPVAFQLESGRL